MLKEIEKKADRMVKRAQALGYVSKTGQSLVPHQTAELLAAAEGFRNLHAYEAGLKKRNPALEELASAGSESEYRLRKGHRGCWVMLGGFSVHLYLSDEGVIADMFAEGAENESVQSTYAFFTEGEDAYAEDKGIDIDDVAEWVGLHYGRNFDKESPEKRMEWLRRYAETMTEAEGLSSNRAALEAVGYIVKPDSD